MNYYSVLINVSGISDKNETNRQTRFRKFKQRIYYRQFVVRQAGVVVGKQGC